MGNNTSIHLPKKQMGDKLMSSPDKKMIKINFFLSPMVSVQHYSALVTRKVSFNSNYGINVVLQHNKSRNNKKKL